MDEGPGILLDTQHISLLDITAVERFISFFVPSVRIGITEAMFIWCFSKWLFPLPDHVPLYCRKTTKECRWSTMLADNNMFNVPADVKKEVKSIWLGLWKRVYTCSPKVEGKHYDKESPCLCLVNRMPKSAKSRCDSCWYNEDRTWTVFIVAICKKSGSPLKAVTPTSRQNDHIWKAWKNNLVS